MECWWQRGLIQLGKHTANDGGIRWNKYKLQSIGRIICLSFIYNYNIYILCQSVYLLFRILLIYFHMSDVEDIITTMDQTITQQTIGFQQFY